jgi:hypothetical protein
MTDDNDGSKMNVRVCEEEYWDAVSMAFRYLTAPLVSNITTSLFFSVLQGVFDFLIVDSLLLCEHGVLLFKIYNRYLL